MEVLLTWIRGFTFCTLFLFTVTLYAQTITDAVQDQRIQHVERIADATNSRVDQLSSTVAELAASMNRFTGIGIGLGAALTILQAAQLILQVRGQRK